MHCIVCLVGSSWSTDPLVSHVLSPCVCAWLLLSRTVATMLPCCRVLPCAPGALWQEAILAISRHARTVLVPEYYTSAKCPACRIDGNVFLKEDASTRSLHCACCGTTWPRDVAAAVNLENVVRQWLTERTRPAYLDSTTAWRFTHGTDPVGWSTKSQAKLAKMAEFTTPQEFVDFFEDMLATEAEARTKRYGPGGKAKARARGKRGRGRGAGTTSTGGGGRADDDDGDSDDDDDDAGTKKQGKPTTLKRRARRKRQRERDKASESESDDPGTATAAPSVAVPTAATTPTVTSTATATPTAATATSAAATPSTAASAQVPSGFREAAGSSAPSPSATPSSPTHTPIPRHPRMTGTGESH